METAIIIHNITEKQITTLFLGLQEQIMELKRNIEPKKPTDYLTRSEVAEMLKCDLSTIHNWTKKGKLKPYAMGNRVYYKRQEVEGSLKPF